MKRRKFIQNLGLGVAPVVVQPLFGAETKTGLPPFEYRRPVTLQEAVTKEGQIILRLEFQSWERVEQAYKPEIHIENRNMLRTKSYFFEQGEDNFSGGIDAPVVSSVLSDIDMLVLWLDKFSEESVITLMDEAGVFAFSYSVVQFEYLLDAKNCDFSGTTDGRNLLLLSLETSGWNTVKICFAKSMENKLNHCPKRENGGREKQCRGEMWRVNITTILKD